MDDLVFRSAVTLAGLIRTRQVSAAEVLTAHLERIDAVNPLLNALVQPAGKAGMAEAQQLDADLARGVLRGPLHGVPFSVKDWIETAGLACAGGDERRRDFVPDHDATVVARLRSAGGILLGKTNVTVTNPVYGRTNNPYDTGRSTSGSSGGEASLIASGGSPLGLGSDSGGSIRTPAHACGVAGLKPTTGRVPLTGHAPPISALNDPRTTIGPMARFVEDLALGLELIGGPDGRDPSTVPVPLGDWRTVDLSSLQVASYSRHEGADPSPDCAAAAVAAAGALASVTRRVDEVLPPRIGESHRITTDYWRRPESEAADRWVPDGPAVLSSERVEEHLFEWDRFRRALIAFMDEYDVIVTPAAELPAQSHGSSEGSLPYTLPYSLTGYPAAVVRVGTTAEGLPVGVQVVGRPWRDDVVLAVAASLELRFGGWRPPDSRSANGQPST